MIQLLVFHNNYYMASYGIQQCYNIVYESLFNAVKKRFITITTASFMSVVMAWFGVNYILATGLHSYGFQSGGTIFVISFFIIQTILLMVTSLLKKQKG